VWSRFTVSTANTGTTHGYRSAFRCPRRYVWTGDGLTSQECSSSPSDAPTRAPVAASPRRTTEPWPGRSISIAIGIDTGLTLRLASWRRWKGSPGASSPRPCRGLWSSTPGPPAVRWRSPRCGGTSHPPTTHSCGDSETTRGRWTPLPTLRCSTSTRDSKGYALCSKGRSRGNAPHGSYWPPRSPRWCGPSASWSSRAVRAASESGYRRSSCSLASTASSL
jgi:hypothetical protein